jgi:type IV pilus assembly protein PilE
VIIGILAGLAYPAYQNSVRESRRGEAFNALSQLAADLERYYSECSAYTAELKALPRACATPGPASLGRGPSGDLSESGYYQITVVTGIGGVPASYQITAAARAGTPQFNDTNCRTIILSSTGVKTSANSGGAATTNCWKR